MSKKLTKEEIIERGNKIHNSKYDYSEFLKNEFDYKNCCTKIPIICHEKDANGNEHGLFWKDVTHHLNHLQGCPKCTRYAKVPFEEVLKRAKNVHGDKYDYSLIKSVGNLNEEKVPIICHNHFKNGTEHGAFMCTFKNHINHKRGCPKCNGGVSYTLTEFKRRLIEKHKEKITFNENDYVDYNTCIKFNCVKHNNFYAVPKNVLQGKGCPFCGTSLLEEEMKYTLDYNNIKYKHNSTFDWLVNEDGNHLRFDFYLPDYNLIIECHGRQHFEPVDIFGGIDSFTKLTKNDEIKYKLAKEHGIEVLYYTETKDVSYHHKLFTRKKDLVKEIYKNKRNE